MHYSNRTGLAPALTCACTCGVTALDLQKTKLSEVTGSDAAYHPLLMRPTNGTGFPMACAAVRTGTSSLTPRSSRASTQEPATGSLAQYTPEDLILDTHSLNQVSLTGQVQAHLVTDAARVIKHLWPAPTCTTHHKVPDGPVKDGAVIILFLAELDEVFTGFWCL